MAWIPEPPEYLKNNQKLLAFNLKINRFYGKGMSGRKDSIKPRRGYKERGNERVVGVQEWQMYNVFFCFCRSNVIILSYQHNKLCFPGVYS